MADKGKINDGGCCERCAAPLGDRRGERVCPACAAHAAGEIATREGIRFYVTRAESVHLGAWLDAEWIPRRIIETHLTFAEAGAAAAARLNRRAAGGGTRQSRFYFVSTDVISTAGHGGDSA